MSLYITIKQNLFSPSEIFQNQLTLWMNRFLIIYAFLLPISNQAKAAAFSIILILFILRRNYLFYLKESIKNPIVIAFLLYMLMYFLWLFGTQNFDFAYKMIKLSKYALFPLLFLSFVDKRFTPYIVSAFIFGVLYSEVLSYLMSMQIIPWKFTLYGFDVYEAYNLGHYEPSPFIDHARYTTALALTVALIANQLLNTKTSLRTKIFASIFMLSATVNISIVGGRIGYIIYIVLLFTLVAFRYRAKAFKPLVLLIVTVSIIATTAYSLSPLFEHRVNQSLHTIEKIKNDPFNFNSSLGARFGIWYYGREMVKENLFFGTGTGDHMDTLRPLIPEKDAFLLHLHHPHNTYMEVLWQFGLVGLLIFLNIFFQIFKYKTSTTYQKEVLLLSTLAVAIAIMTEPFGPDKFYLPLWVTLVSAAITRKEYPSFQVDNFSKKTLSMYAVIILALLLLAFFQ